MTESTITPSSGPEHRLRRVVALTALILVAAAGLAACSSGDDKKPSEGTTTTSSTASTTTTAASTDDGSGGGAGAGNNSGGGSSSGSSGGNSGGSGTAAPAFGSVTTPDNIDCHNGNSQMFTASWTTTNATKVTISIDGPGVYKEYPANGSDSLPFNCSTSHTFLFTAYNADGATATKTITLQPRNVQSSTTETSEGDGNV